MRCVRIDAGNALSWDSREHALNQTDLQLRGAKTQGHVIMLFDIIVLMIRKRILALIGGKESANERSERKLVVCSSLKSTESDQAAKEGWDGWRVGRYVGLSSQAGFWSVA